MIRKMSPNAVSRAVDRSVWWVVNDAAYRIVDGDTNLAVHDALYETVAPAASRAVGWVVHEAVRVSPPHPNLDRFVGEIRQARSRSRLGAA